MPSLRGYLIRRILLIIPLFFFIALLIFTLIHLAPGDPVQLMLAARVSPEVIQQIRSNYGLDQPIYVQFFVWLSNLAHGDLGYSFVSGRPVIDMIAERFWPTVELVLLAQLLSLIVAVVLGVIAATRQYSLRDQVSTAFALFGRTMPNFYIALLMIFVFTLTLGWFPATGVSTIGANYSSIFEAIADHLAHIIMPLFVLTFYYCGFLFRIVRSAMLDVLKQDYILTAKSKGLSETMVIYKHALKNAMLPSVTVVGMFVGYMLSGAAVVEVVFARPGLGSLFVNLALRRDYVAMLSLNMVFALMILLSNLAVDLIYAYLDPRIRY